MKIYLVTELPKLIQSQPVPAMLVSEADYRELERKFEKAKSCLKLALRQVNSNGILYSDIVELLGNQG